MSQQGYQGYADRWLSGKPIYLTEMDRCAPQSALARQANHQQWRVMPYQGKHLSGHLLAAGVETEAPPIRFAHETSGWHAISIGAWRLKDWYVGHDGTPKILAKLTGDETYTVLNLPTRPSPSDPIEGWHMWTGEEELSECFWKIADLSDRNIELAQPRWIETGRDGTELIRCSLSNIAYIKLIPLTDAEVCACQSDAAHLPIYAHNDVMLTQASTPEELRRNIEPFGDSDFTRIYWEGAMGDLSSYFQTRNRTPEAPGRSDFFHSHARNEAQCWRKWRNSGHDPLQVASEATHALGMEFHVCHRLGGFRLPPAHDYWDHGDTFYNQHPELRGRDRNGNATPRLSFAYPEVRHHVIETFREMMAYNIDGLCLLYNRRHPLVEYEAPVVDGFHKQHGSDPHEISPNDPTWLKYRASILTTFMRELKETLDLPMTAIVASNETENLSFGLNPREWIEASIVDTLVPYTDLPEWNHTARSWQDPSALAPYVALTANTSCQLAPCLHPANLTAPEYRNTAAGLSSHGAEALFFWWGDTGSVAHYGPEWNAVRRLGHLEEIKTWQKNGAPSLDAPVYPIQSLDGWDSNYVTPA